MGGSAVTGAPRPPAAPPPVPPPEPPPAAKPAEPAKKPEPVPLMMVRRPVEPAVAMKPPEVKPTETPAEPRPQAASPSAAKRRLAELAAQGKQGKASMGPASARPLDLDLDLDAREPKAGPPSRRKSSSSRMRAVRQASSDEPVPSVSSPSSRRRSSRAMRAVTPPTPPEPPTEAAQPAPKAAAKPDEAAVPEPERRPPVARPQRPRPAPGEDLSDARIRQIYAQYVEAKRAAKESTAGVTYESLAKQLRQQAEKLKASHPQKSVDYNVVMKDGKPTLKPILR